MSKELTEKWKNSELPEDCYYILDKNGHIKKERTCFYSHTEEQCFCFTSNRDIEEVLAPVPSYEEFQRFQEQLKEVYVEKESLEIENCRLKKRYYEQAYEADAVIHKTYEHLFEIDSTVKDKMMKAKSFLLGYLKKYYDCHKNNGVKNDL